MLIDCDSCTMRDISCHDCVVSIMLSSGPVELSSKRANAFAQPAMKPALDATEQLTTDATSERLSRVELDDAEQAALRALSAGGLVPPLRFEGDESATG